MSEREHPHRATDVWPLVKRNLPVLFMIGGMVVALVTIYNKVEFHDTVINPDAMAEWRASQAEQKAKIREMTRLAKRRWCMTKELVNGKDQKALMQCLD